MSLLLKVLLTIAVTMLLFEGMVTAFHLLNLPSNLAVAGGFALLLILAAGGFVVFRIIWKRRYSNV